MLEAVDALLISGVFAENPLLEQLAAISVGVVNGRLLLDLCYEEDSRAETDMNVVMTGTGGIIEVQGTAEGRPFTREQAIGLLDMAAGGIDTLIAEQSAVFDGIRGA